MPTTQDLCVTLLGLVTGMACTGAERQAAAPQAAGAMEAALPLEFEREMLAVAAAYKSWPRVSDQANFAPTDCMAPRSAGVQRSDSDDAGTHGRKLYYLFAKDPATYTEASWCLPDEEFDPADLSRRLIGQALVKQSWTAVEGAARRDGDQQSYFVDGDQAFHTGEQFHIGEARDLFVMLKLDPTTPATDAGWVYGTLTPDGQRVTASGRIASCMGCHVDAGFDRLFGLPRARESRGEIKLRAQSVR